MGYHRPGLLIAALLCAAAPAAWSQAPGTAVAGSPAALVGLTLGDLYGRFGVPLSVHAVRGEEVWQDDVVMVYGQGDFYLYGDRVWQVSLKAGYGLELGDPRQAAALALGEEARDRGDHFLLPLPGEGWPLELRVNIDGAGRVSAIYVYRPDF